MTDAKRQAFPSYMHVVRVSHAKIDCSTASNDALNFSVRKISRVFALETLGEPVVWHGTPSTSLSLSYWFCVPNHERGEIYFKLIVLAGRQA
jgi:hypothetical protein